MLFTINPNTPQFAVFEALNSELLGFLERAIPDSDFRRRLLSDGAIGQACWDNAKANNARAKSDLTKDRFKKLFIEVQKLERHERERLHSIFTGNQELSEFFNNPDTDLLESFPAELKTKLKALMSHLYTATKDLQDVIDGSGGQDIGAHFASYRAVNGNVCKACGMALLSPIRVDVSEEEQWRADYDHQLCKSKYPIFAVHPKNLIPLCNTCNQDAKKAKDLFKCPEGNERPFFYPYEEAAFEHIDIKVADETDPEVYVYVEWTSQDRDIINKLNSWDDVYEIKSLVEGHFNVLEHLILDEINPISFEHMQEQIADRARAPNAETLKRKEWAFWNYKLFHALSQLDLGSFWEKSNFMAEQHGTSGGEYVLEGVRGV